MLIKWLNEFAKPDRTYLLCNQLLPWFVITAIVALPLGMLWGLAFAPADYQQFDVYRIMYIHVPTAALSMSTYVAMAVAGFVALVWQWRTALTTMIAIAPVGAVITLVSLITGAVWGKPTWGTYWIWDARLTSQLILLFLYIGVYALYLSFEDKLQGGKAAAVLSIVGVINIPIIKYSVEWWNTLHQTASISKLDKPSMPPNMYVPLLICMLGVAAFIGTCVLLRMRSELIKRDAHRPWVSDFMKDANSPLKHIPMLKLTLILGLLASALVIYLMLNQGFKFADMNAFFDMGGRGLYVWLSFGIGLGLMLLVLSHSIFMNRLVRLTVEKQQARAERILAARQKRKQRVQGELDESKA